MPKLPSLVMAQQMCKNYRNDDFTLWIVEGNLRVGKTALSMKAGFQCLDYFWGDPVKWESIKPFMGWHPAENVEKWLNITDRQPFFIWDDAGMWLFSLDWGDPLMVAIQKYMNVIATDYNNLVLTTPSAGWILSKIANMPNSMRIKVVKRDGGISDAPSKLYSRLGIAYQPWRSPDKKSHGVYKRFYDKFSCLIPQDVYEIYFPIRKEYAHLAKMEIKNQLRLRSTLSKVQQLKLDYKLKRLQDEEIKYAKALDDEIKKAGIE